MQPFSPPESNYRSTEPKEIKGEGPKKTTYSRGAKRTTAIRAGGMRFKKASYPEPLERNFQQAWYESESQMNIADSHVKPESHPLPRVGYLF